MARYWKNFCASLLFNSKEEEAWMRKVLLQVENLTDAELGEVIDLRVKIFGEFHEYYLSDTLKNGTCQIAAEFDGCNDEQEQCSRQYQ